MSSKNECICPICGEGTLWTDYTDGFKWGRAYCDRCDCGGPEVLTGYDEHIDAPWRANARKLFVDVVDAHVIKRCEDERMNKEEAAAVLDAMIFGVYPDDDITINKIGIEAVRFAITALRGPQPDPITGLVPCGCGGKAKIWPSEPTQFTKVITDYEVGCTECAMTTGWVRGKQEHAVKVWNTAMGWKGGAEELGDVKSAQRLTDI